MHEIETKPTILLVEDDAMIRMYGVDLLEDSGFAVLEAGDADEAVAILDDHDDVSLLFSDIEMPGTMDGLGLARFVHDRWPKIRLLLTSGNQHPRASAIPDDGRFMSKPWEEGALLRQISDLLAA